MSTGPGPDGFDGVLTVRIAEQELQVAATLRGHFEPIDGRYHWWGRLAADPAIGALVAAGTTEAWLATPHGAAPATLGDPDFWGRLRVVGVSTPPYAVPPADDAQPQIEA